MDLSAQYVHLAFWTVQKVNKKKICFDILNIWDLFAAVLFIIYL